MSDGSLEERALQVWKAFLQARDAGDQPDIRAWMADHAEIARLLKRYHANDAELQAFAPAPLVANPADDARDTSAEDDEILSDHGEPEEPVEDPEPTTDPGLRAPGQIFGGFRLIRKLGQGGFGEVWEAEQLSLSRRVALKLLLAHRDSPHVVRRFRQEARAACGVEHEGVVRIYDTNAEAGLPYIVMELVGEGLTLRHLIDHIHQRSSIPVGAFTKLARFLADAAHALHAIHESGAVSAHRDIKPANLLVDRHDRPKLVDFGTAKVSRPDDTRLTDDLAILGTALYMAPEQAKGSAHVDRRADVWSLGAVLHEILCGRTVVPPQDNPHVVLGAVTNLRQAPDPAAQASGVPDELARICRGALAPHPDDRTPTAGEFAAQLERWLARQTPRSDLTFRAWLDETPEPCAAMLEPRQIVAGHFEIVRLLGTGGMGSVYLARHTRSGANVAIKHLPRPDDDGLQRLEAEQRASARLNHVNIRRVHDLLDGAGGLLLIMDYVEGITLAERLEGGALGPDELRTVARTVARALEHAHDRDVLHRDVKPGNVLLPDRGEPQLADFGLARIDNQALVSRTGVGLGTTVYASPEQLEDGRQASMSSDVYGFGATLLHAITGRRPHPGSSLETLPTPWGALIQRCLDHDPQARPRNGAALLELVEQACARASPQPPLAGPPTPRPATAHGLRCARCHADNAESDDFCRECGEGLRVDCLACHASVRVDLIRCTSCSQDQQKCRDAEKLLARGRHFEIQHLYGKATRQAEQALALIPGWPEAREAARRWRQSWNDIKLIRDNARRKTKDGRLPQALRVWRNLIARCPRDREAHEAVKELEIRLRHQRIADARSGLASALRDRDWPAMARCAEQLRDDVEAGDALLREVDEKLELARKLLLAEFDRAETAGGSLTGLADDLQRLGLPDDALSALDDRIRAAHAERAVVDALGSRQGEGLLERLEAFAHVGSEAPVRERVVQALPLVVPLGDAALRRAHTLLVGNGASQADADEACSRARAMVRGRRRRRVLSRLAAAAVVVAALGAGTVALERERVDGLPARALAALDAADLPKLAACVSEPAGPRAWLAGLGERIDPADSSAARFVPAAAHDLLAAHLSFRDRNLPPNQEELRQLHSLADTLRAACAAADTSWERSATGADQPLREPLDRRPFSEWLVLHETARESLGDPARLLDLIEDDVVDPHVDRPALARRLPTDLATVIASDDRNAETDRRWLESVREALARDLLDDATARQLRVQAGWGDMHELAERGFALPHGLRRELHAPITDEHGLALPPLLEFTDPDGGRLVFEIVEGRTIGAVGARRWRSTAWIARGTVGGQGAGSSLSVEAAQAWCLERGLQLPDEHLLADAERHYGRAAEARHLVAGDTSALPGLLRPALHTKGRRAVRTLPRIAAPRRWLAPDETLELSLEELPPHVTELRLSDGRVAVPLVLEPVGEGRQSARIGVADLLAATGRAHPAVTTWDVQAWHPSPTDVTMPLESSTFELRVDRAEPTARVVSCPERCSADELTVVVEAQDAHSGVSHFEWIEDDERRPVDARLTASGYELTWEVGRTPGRRSAGLVVLDHVGHEKPLVLLTERACLSPTAEAWLETGDGVVQDPWIDADGAAWVRAPTDTERLLIEVTTHGPFDATDVAEGPGLSALDIDANSERVLLQVVDPQRVVDTEMARFAVVGSDDVVLPLPVRIDAQPPRVDGPLRYSPVVGRPEVEFAFATVDAGCGVLGVVLESLHHEGVSVPLPEFNPTAAAASGPRVTFTGALELPARPGGYTAVLGLVDHVGNHSAVTLDVRLDTDPPVVDVVRVSSGLTSPPRTLRRVAPDDSRWVLDGQALDAPPESWTLVSHEGFTAALGATGYDLDHTPDWTDDAGNVTTQVVRAGAVLRDGSSQLRKLPPVRALGASRILTEGGSRTGRLLSWTGADRYELAGEVPSAGWAFWSTTMLVADLGLDGESLVCGGEDGTLLVQDGAGERDTSTGGADLIRVDAGAVGRCAAALDAEGKAWIWPDLRDLERMIELPAPGEVWNVHDGEATWADVACERRRSGTQIVAMDSRGRLAAWPVGRQGLASPATSLRAEGATAQTHLALSADANLLAVVGAKAGQLHVFTTDRLETVLDQPAVGDETITSLAFARCPTRGRQHLLIGLATGSVLLLDCDPLAGGKPILLLELDGRQLSPVTAMRLDEATSQLTVTHASGNLEIYALPEMLVEH